MATKINSIDDLISAEEQASLEQTARNAYQPSYDASVNRVNQSYESNKMAIESAWNDYLSTTDKQKQGIEQSVINSAIKRGMGRSSRTTYEMSEALSDFAQTIANYNKNVNDQLSSLEMNRSMDLDQLSADYETNVLNQVYNLRSQAIQNAQWLAEFNLASRGSGGGGSPVPKTPPFVDLTEEETPASNVGYSGLSSFLSVNAPNYSASDFSNYTGYRNGKYYYKGKQVTQQVYQNVGRLG